MCRFYGWSAKEIEVLDFEDYWRYHKAIKHLRAREMLDLVEVVKQPWRKKQDQEKFINSLQKNVYQDQNVKQMTTSEIFNELRAMDGR